MIEHLYYLLRYYSLAYLCHYLNLHRYLTLLHHLEDLVMMESRSFKNVITDFFAYLHKLGKLDYMFRILHMLASSKWCLMPSTNHNLIQLTRLISFLSSYRLSFVQVPLFLSIFHISLGNLLKALCLISSGFLIESLVKCLQIGHGV